MAGEITITTRLSYTNGPRSISWSPASASVDQSGTDFTWKTQAIGTSPEAIALGEVASGAGAVMMIQNLDATNFVTVGYDDSGLKGFVKLMPGDPPFIFRCSQAAPYAQADTDTCQIQYAILEA